MVNLGSTFTLLIALALATLGTDATPSYGDSLTPSRSSENPFPPFAYVDAGAQRKSGSAQETRPKRESNQMRFARYVQFSLLPQDPTDATEEVLVRFHRSSATRPKVSIVAVVESGLQDEIWEA
jgi:hypothetical protein